MKRTFTTYPKTSIKANSDDSRRYIVRVYRADEDIEFSDYDSARKYAISEYDKMGVDRVQILDSFDNNALMDEYINEPEEVE